MKHLLSICITIFLLTSSLLAQQVENYETRTIAGKQYIIYKVKAGDTWGSIAEKFGVTERSLIDGNKQTNGSLKGVITLKVLMDKSTKSTSSVVIKNTEKEAPVEYNKLPKFGENAAVKKPIEDKPKIYGQELRTEFKGANSLTVYRIGVGDKIEDLAKYFNSSVKGIVTQNNLTSNTLLPGKILKIPLGSSEAENTETLAPKTEAPKTETPKTILVQPTSQAAINPVIEEKPKQAPIAIIEEKKPVIQSNYITRTIKGKEYIIYNVNKNDTWKSIALKFGLSENKLKAENLQTNGSLVGVNTLKIPTDSSLKNNDNLATKQPQNVVDNKQNLLPKFGSNNKVDSNNIEVNNLNEESALTKETTNEVPDLNTNETKLGDYIVVKKIGRLFIKHTVISGEDLTRISKENYTVNSKIISVNSLKTNKLYTGQILLIPTDKKTLLKLTGLDFDLVEKQNKEKELLANEEIETNKTDQTINIIDNQNNAAASNVSNNQKQDTTKIIRYNWGDPIYTTTHILDSNAQKTAKDLSKSINAAELHANANSGETKESYAHVVMDGESIEYIAKKYKISTSDIANWNNLYQNRIRVGQELIVNLERARKPYLVINSVSPETSKKIKTLDKSDRIKSIDEKGLCLLSDDPFIGVAHKSIPVGTLLLLTSTENYKKIYVRVTSILENSNPDIILQVDKTIAKQLAFNSSLTNVYLSYSLVE